MSTDLDQQIARVQSRQSHRRGHDGFAIAAALILSVTVLVPWLIGRWPARDTFFRTNQGVFDTAVRKDGTYFLTDWSMGCAILLLLLGVFLIVRPWSLRVGFVVFGFIAFGAGVFLMSSSASLWQSAERESAIALDETVYPFGSHYYTCGYKTLTVNGAIWQVHEAQNSTTAAATSGCNLVEVYRGWNMITIIRIPNDETVKSVTVADDGTVSVIGSSGKEVLRFPITTPPN